MPDTPFETFVSYLQQTGRLASFNGTKGTGRCPVPGHGKENGDHKPSLSFSQGGDGRLLVKCHAGCSFEEIIAAAGMDPKDAFPEPVHANGHGKSKQAKRVEATHIFHDSGGQEVARKLRYPEKNFAWWRDGKPGLQGFKPPLYNLHKLYQDKDSAVYIVEGEKDADTLAELGLLAVSPPSGASKDTQRPKWREMDTAELVGRDVFILADADATGIAHQLAVARALHGRAASIRLVPPFPHPDGQSTPTGWDVSDWVQALRLSGKDNDFIMEELDSIFGSSPEFDPDNLPDWIPPETSDKSDKTRLLDDEPEPWSEPIPLDAFELPEWPNDLFPEPLRAYVTAVTETTETPPELAALTALAVVATAIQGKYSLRIEGDHIDELAIWTLVALPPGERKSAVLQKLRAPLDNWQFNQAELLGPEFRRVASLRKTMESAIKKKRQKIAEMDDPEEWRRVSEETAKAESELPDLPVYPCLTTADVTPEKLAALMALHDERMSILSDEAGIFDIIAGRYSKGQLNLDIFNQAFTGIPHSVDRIGRDPIRLRHPVLSMGLVIQPDALQFMKDGARFRGRGLLGRFLFAIPRPKVGSRTLDSSAGIAEAIRIRYATDIYSLLDDEGDRNEQGHLQRRILTLSPEAHAIWKQFQRELEPRMGEGADMENLRDWGGKLPGAIARVSAVLHAVKYAGSSPLPNVVQGEEMEAAVRLGQLLIPHVFIAFDLMQADPVREDARRLLRWIKRRKERTTFTARDAQRSNQTHFERTAKVKPALALLEEYGYIRLQGYTESSPKGGRPSELYEVNPKVFA